MTGTAQLPLPRPNHGPPPDDQRRRRQRVLCKMSLERGSAMVGIDGDWPPVGRPCGSVERSNIKTKNLL